MKKLKWIESSKYNLLEIKGLMYQCICDLKELKEGTKEYNDCKEMQNELQYLLDNQTSIFW